jgi:hypothetical protein
MDQEVRFSDFIEGGFEGFDEVCRQFSDKTYGIGK